MCGLVRIHHKDTCSTEIGLCLQLLITTLRSIANTIGRTYVSSQEINKTCISDNHYESRGGSIFNPVIAYVSLRLANVVMLDILNKS